LAAGSDLVIADTDNAGSKVTFGVTGGTHGLDITINSVTAGEDILYDAAAKTLTFDNIDILLSDGDFIKFGDGADFTMDSSTAKNLDIVGASSDESDIINIGADTTGVDVKFFPATTSDYMLWDASGDVLSFVGADIGLDSDSQLFDAVNAGTKEVHGTPIVIEFRPTASETLTYVVPTGYDLIVTDGYGWKIAAVGSGANDDINIDDNADADIFDTEELDAVADQARFQLDNLDDSTNEIEAGESLKCVGQEASSVDCIVIIEGYLKTAD
jgi:hypothetical protein